MSDLDDGKVYTFEVDGGHRGPEPVSKDEATQRAEVLRDVGYTTRVVNLLDEHGARP
jgi:hypothetical protein